MVSKFFKKGFHALVFHLRKKILRCQFLLPSNSKVIEGTSPSFWTRLVRWSEMGSPLLALSSSTTFLKPLKWKPNHNSRISSSALQCYSSLKPDDICKFPRTAALVFLTALSFNGKSRKNVSLSGHGQKLSDFKVKSAAAVPGSADNSEKKPNDLGRTLQLGSMFVIWYLLNIYFNIYNKQVLKTFPFPATVSAFQFGCGTMLALLMWGLNLHKRPKITRSQFGSVLLLALGHTIGNLLTNVSLGRVAVSFTHTIKAMEPFFTVVLSVLLLGEKPSPWVVASLVPIVGGVALASFTEASFNWIGFGSAMASNLTNQSRNVFSKKVMIKDEEALDNINLFCVMTMTSFIMMMPIAILLEGFKLSPSYFHYAASQGVNVKELCVKGLLAGFCFHTYQQVSYNILHKVSPVTHSVGNCLKRIVVIVSSIIFFQTPVSAINALGTAIAIAGVFLYSRAKRIKSAPKTA